MHQDYGKAANAQCVEMGVPENRTWPASFQAAALYTSANVFMSMVDTVYYDHYEGSSAECTASYNVAVSRSQNSTIHVYSCFAVACIIKSMNQAGQKELERLFPKIRSIEPSGIFKIIS